MWTDRPGRLTIAAALLACASRMSAQAAPGPACDYRDCALGIAPAWSGLRVVRGERETRVASLGFFWTRDVSPAFEGSEARRNARRAVALRRAGAFLTDAGILLGGFAAAQAVSQGRLGESARPIAIAGATALALSVPLQFAADGALSRAVWWHNVRFAR